MKQHFAELKSNVKRSRAIHTMQVPLILAKETMGTIFDVKFQKEAKEHDSPCKYMEIYSRLHQRRLISICIKCWFVSGTSDFLNGFLFFSGFFRGRGNKHLATMLTTRTLTGQESQNRIIRLHDTYINM